MDHHAQVPIHPEHLDMENVLRAPNRNIRCCQNVLCILDALISRYEFGRPPTVVHGLGHVHSPRDMTSCTKAREEVSIPAIRFLSVFPVSNWSQNTFAPMPLDKDAENQLEESLVFKKEPIMKVLITGGLGVNGAVTAR